MIFFYLLVAGMPLVNQTLFARFLSDLTTVKYFGLASLLYAVIHMAVRSRPAPALRSGLAGQLLAFYALIVWSHFSLSLPIAWDLSPFLSFTSFLVLFFIVIALVDTPARLRWTVLVAIASVGLGSVYMVREWLQYHNVYKDFRPGWVVGDSNYFTLSALFCIPLAYYLLQTRRPWWERAFLVGCILLTVVAIGLGASRGGLIGLAAECGYLVFHSRRRMVNLMIIAALLAGTTAFTPISSLNRLLHPDSSDIEAQDNRLIVWRAGARMIAQHPLAGIGLGNFKPMVLSYEGSGRKEQSLAHNTYIEVAAELGLPALLLFVAILATAFRIAGRARGRLKNSRSIVHQCALGLQAGLVGCLPAIFFLSAESQKLLWLVIFLAPCVDALSREEAEDMEAPAPLPAAPRMGMRTQQRELAEIFR